jgi:SAM-dependent methyltransferase
MSVAVADCGYALNPGGIYVPNAPVKHRDDEYDQAGFDVLRDIQSRHFWYQGRHRFLLQALRDHLGSSATGDAGGRGASAISSRNPAPYAGDGGGLAAIDLGGGCGGWLSYLNEHAPGLFTELALSDSSVRALEMARPVVGRDVARYQIDLLNLGWKDRWDVAFLLDVLEHVPQDLEALRQTAMALRPGGLLFVTTPALKFFWSYNDELAAHVRRYSRSDFARLAANTGLALKFCRYFMFFLSPMLWLSRLAGPNLKTMSKQAIHELIRRTHRVPTTSLNGLLKFIFNLETPLGLRVPFPWGTSILGVFQKL